MTPRVLFLFLLLISLTSGCVINLEPKITETEAKSIVLEEHYNEDYGEVVILSVNHKDNKYIIEWENKGNCESGTDYVNDQDGEILMYENSIC